MKLNIKNATLTNLGKSFEEDQLFVKNLYADESDPIFEFSSFHVLSYLSFDSEVYAIENEGFKAVLLSKNDGDLFLFTPRVTDIDKFVKWLGENGQISKIANVSPDFVERFSTLLNGTVTPRSKREAIYDVDLLNKLEGKNFAKLRATKRKLLESGILSFKKVTQDNISDAYSVLKQWQDVQGGKYEKNKYEKERFVYETFSKLASNTADLLFEVGYVNNVPLSVCAMHKVEWKDNWGVIYLVKGINRPDDGGVHGVSDATYCHLFEAAQKWNVRFLNDGELGTEQGTSDHKLRFMPVNFLKSYDISLKTQTEVIDINSKIV